MGRLVTCCDQATPTNMERQRSFFRYGRMPIVSVAMTVFVAGIAVLNVAHPLLHPFEGGSLDALLANGNLWALAWLDFTSGMAGD